MQYRREIDGLRAVAVVPVILFHAGLSLFSGGYVGVDVFFVISGYLITGIIFNEMLDGKFTFSGFYERRARRLLPALFLVLLCSIPAAWFLLFPSDMRDFARSLRAVPVFISNFYFYQSSGYFDGAAELKPLLHTWSLAVEEQFYLFFPAFLLAALRFGIRWAVALMLVVLSVSFLLAEVGSVAHQAAAFYLLPFRIWELLVGGLLAVYHFSRKTPSGRFHAQAGSFIGIAMILAATFLLDDSTPFPGRYALLPVLGTALIIHFATPETYVGKILGSRILVGIGLVSYSAYLWHQSIFAFFRHAFSGHPSIEEMLALILLTFFLAYLSWRFVEAPFRNRNFLSRKKIFSLSLVFSLIIILLGEWGAATKGFVDRYDISQLPQPWRDIPCHGEARVSKISDALGDCIAQERNHRSGDIFLLGDSHAAQLYFPFQKIAEDRSVSFGFINTERMEDFPYSFWSGRVNKDPVVDHVLAVSDPEDLIVVTFHRGHLNDHRDRHISLSEEVLLNAASEIFYENMNAYSERFSKAGVRVYLVLDAPLLNDVSSLEKCAHLNGKFGTNPCVIAQEQDLHTRKRQEMVFNRLAKDHPDVFTVLDVSPSLYGDQSHFNPIAEDGSYRMFDRHHLTKSAALTLVPYFSRSL